jgi:hypothetical protein
VNKILKTIYQNSCSVRTNHPLADSNFAVRFDPHEQTGLKF